MGKPDLIVAPATASGRGAIGIVRLTGSGVEELAFSLLGRELTPRLASLCNFLGSDSRPIDQGLAIFFPGPHSYTGESMLELQGHGGIVVQQLILRRCIELGARIAEPGEFTKRAFLNSRMDLTQAEAVSDLIDAQSEHAARSAMRSLQGEFSRRVTELVRRLIDLRMLVEANMDFPEEGLDGLPVETMVDRQRSLLTAIDELLVTAKRGSRLRSGAKLVLLGSPNVGKSSLLNRLAEQDVAIVSDIPGTTRDVIREHIVINGLPFEIVDTAGIRESADPLEQLGMARTRQAAVLADVILWVTEYGRDAPDELVDTHVGAIPKIKVINKIDLHDGEARTTDAEGIRTIYLSARSGAGIDLLRSELVKAIGWHVGDEDTILARARHVVALETARTHVCASSGNLHSPELFAEELRLAQNALSAITGEFTADELLGVIFSRYCIGK